MLMTVLKGELATRQSKALIRIFKQMKDYIVDNQPLLRQREYLQLSLQTTRNTQDLLDLRKSLTAVDDKVASIIDTLGDVVTKSELANVMQDFSNPTIRREWLILNGQPVESGLAYQQIYHCGASSKDGGNKVTTITAVTDGDIDHAVIDQLLNNPVLMLR